MTDKVAFKLATEEEKKLVRQIMGTNEGDIRQAVSNLRSWLKTQPHLPHVMDDGRLERMYICCKCSIEKTKKTLDAYYTLKKKFPEYLMNRDPMATEVTEIGKQCVMLTVPRLTEDCHRVGCITNLCLDANKLNIIQSVKVILMAVEYMLSFDYSVGYIFLVDLKNLTAAHLTKIGIRDIFIAETIARKAYSKRIIAIHFINSPKIIDMLLAIVYPAIPEKLRSRVYTHLPGSDALFDHVSRSCVPNEMGGTAGPAEGIMYGVLDCMTAVRDWYLQEDKYVADESKRPANNSYRNEYDLFGMDGSFKKLQVD